MAVHQPYPISAGMELSTEGTTICGGNWKGCQPTCQHETLRMATIEELRAKIKRLEALLNKVMDQQAHQAITDLIAEAEREIRHAGDERPGPP